jgi:phosphoadenosine phosphosulfate reductase
MGTLQTLTHLNPNAIVAPYQDEIDVLNQQLEDAAPQRILEHIVDTFGKRAVVVTSFQMTGLVTLHMLQDIAPGFPVMTLDTGLLFPETVDLIDNLEANWTLNLTRVQPRLSVGQQAGCYGDKLWERNADYCCHMRKVVPLRKALKGYDAWISGVRRDQSKRRANTPVVSWDARNERIKYCPLATWTERMIWTYADAYDLPTNALYEQGYPSIGCQPCTHAIKSGEDARAGRWVGSAKTECGIHT